MIPKIMKMFKGWDYFCKTLYVLLAVPFTLKDWGLKEAYLFKKPHSIGENIQIECKSPPGVNKKKTYSVLYIFFFTCCQLITQSPSKLLLHYD